MKIAITVRVIRHLRRPFGGSPDLSPGFESLFSAMDVSDFHLLFL